MTADAVPTVVEVNDGHIELLTSPGWREYLERDVLPWILSTIPAADLAEVLEVGPGPGLMTELLHPRVGAHDAIEIDHGLAASLRERFEPDGVEVICADATTTDLESGRFTTALCLTMLHHVPSAERQDALFSEVLRLLCPGGHLVVLDSLDSPALRTFHADDTFVPVDLDTLDLRLRAAGFVEPVIERWDPPRRPGAKVRFVARKPLEPT
jgi:SAM-dependent methyltransferase